MLRGTLLYDLKAQTDIEFTQEGVRITMPMPVGPDVLAEGA
jgi:hypothetical protein